jgi:hypothetical protein
MIECEHQDRKPRVRLFHVLQRLQAMLVRVVEIEAEHARHQVLDVRGHPIAPRRVGDSEEACAGDAKLRILKFRREVEPQQQRFGQTARMTLPFFLLGVPEMPWRNLGCRNSAGMSTYRGRNKIASIRPAVCSSQAEEYLTYGARPEVGRLPCS